MHKLKNDVKLIKYSKINDINNNNKIFFLFCLSLFV